MQLVTKTEQTLFDINLFVNEMDNLSDSDDDDIESMELLDGNYQNYMQWIRPDRFWDMSPSVRVAIVRYILVFDN